jgi:RNA polymerase sigma-70 factor (ECF subfamily)
MRLARERGRLGAALLDSIAFVASLQGSLQRDGGAMEQVDGLEDRQAALNHFFSDVERRAFRIALISSGDREDAHDIVQDAMLKLVQRYAQRPSAEWPLLFHRILHNRLTDWHRRAKVRRQLTRWFGWDNGQGAEEAVELLPARAAYDPLQQCTQEERIERLETALSHLPLRQQQSFLLRIWEGLSVKQTAAVMGCSQGSVKTHLSRALARLREQLGDWPP